MNLSKLIVTRLEQAGVEYVFGVPGGALEDINTALYHSKKIRPIVTKHEEGAAFMADGFARVSGRLGVCCSTAGPGATNLITGVAVAHGDSIPLLVLTGQVATSVMGKGAIQEASPEGIDIVGIFSKATKYSTMLVNEERANHSVTKALTLALSPPAGPVHLNLPADVMKQTVTLPPSCCLFFESKFHEQENIKGIVEKLFTAKRPAILAGWGVVLSKGARVLFDLAKHLQIPVATTPKAKGIFPEFHELALGGIGFAGSPVAMEFFEQGVDVLLSVGTSFNEMSTCGWDKRFAPTEHLIHINANHEEIGKNYETTIGLVGDAETVLAEISASAQSLLNAGKIQFQANSRYRLLQEVAHLKNKHDDKKTEQSRTERYHPKLLTEDIQRAFPDDTIYFADIGTTMAWALRYLKMKNPYSFYVPLGFGSMGYAVAAPVGAKLAVPDRPVVALVGDGSFLMNGFEVATAVNYDIPVVWIVFNNAMLGMVYHGRKLFKKPIPEGIPSRFKQVDFVKVAEGLGAKALRIDRPGGLTPDLVREILAEKRPTVIDVLIDEEAVPPIHSRIATVDKLF